MTNKQLLNAMINPVRLKDPYWPEGEFIIWDENREVFVEENNEVYSIVDVVENIENLQPYGTKAERIEKEIHKSFGVLMKNEATPLGLLEGNKQRLIEEILTILGE